jgi:2-succinyl-5-enolpyruvyl-6-hydroxy-3-cyclohexene-1-carboxylate synthase
VLNGLVVVAIGVSRHLQRTVFYLLGSLAVAHMLQAVLVMAPMLAYLLLG